MKNTLIKLLLLNTLIYLLLLVIFYFSAFLSGYGSNAGFLSHEKRLFVYFFIFHLVLNFFLTYRFRQLNWTGITISTLLIIMLYVVAAWRFEYF